MPTVDPFDSLEDDLPFTNNVVESVTLFKEPCFKCNGTGKYQIGYAFPRLVGCFKCKGVGFFEFKMSKEAREKSRKYAQTRKEQQVVSKQQSVAAWLEAHPIESAWLNESKFDFAVSMMQALNKYGSFTEKQLAAVSKCALAHAERKAQWEAERKTAETNAPVIDNSKIEVAFEAAKSKGIKSPKLRLDSFVFSMAKADSKNAGALYVKGNDGEYLGKVLGGKFLKTRACTVDMESAVVAAANDPEAAAIAYGKREGACSVCGRPLTTNESLDRGIGPICANRMGW